MSKKLRLILLVISCALVLLALIGFIGFRSYYKLMDTEARRVPASVGAVPVSIRFSPTPLPTAVPTPDPNDPLEHQDIYSLLLLGTDDRDNALYSRTDTMMLVSVNKNTRQIVLTSFLRDTYLWISGYGCQRLNVANEVGGPETLIATLREAYGVEADNYAYVNFYSFMDVVDALGGIELELTDDEVYFINLWVMDGDLQMDAADRHELAYREDHQYHLDGGQTLAYCRTRDLGSDLVRTSQQRRVITAIWDKARSASFSELAECLRLVLPCVTTDVSELRCLSLLSGLPKYKDYEIVQLQIPDETAMHYSTVDEMSVIIPYQEQNREILYNTLHGMADGNE